MTDRFERLAKGQRHRFTVCSSSRSAHVAVHIYLISNLSPFSHPSQSTRIGSLVADEFVVPSHLHSPGEQRIANRWHHTHVQIIHNLRPFAPPSTFSPISLFHFVRRVSYYGHLGPICSYPWSVLSRKHFSPGPRPRPRNPRAPRSSPPLPFFFPTPHGMAVPGT